MALKDLQTHPGPQLHLLTGSAGMIFASNHTHFALAAAPQTPSIQAGSTEPLTGKELKVEFNEETGQTVLVGSTMWPDKRPGQPLLACKQTLLFSYPSTSHICSFPYHLNPSLFPPLVHLLDIP